MAVERQRPRLRSLQAGALIALIAAIPAWRNTDFHSPPRFDGAGYAVLAKSLAQNQGYREIDHPDAPRHAHFPPGYPLALSLIWRVTGPSALSAHVFSFACAIAATLAAHRWFLTIYRPRVALLLGLALAFNWTWQRTAGSIQSEPLFLLLEMLSLLAAGWASRRPGLLSGLLLGALLAACALTRQVGIALALALVVDLLPRGLRSTAIAACLSFGVFMTPWVLWLVSVREHTQASLLTPHGLPKRILTQSLFYLQRLPDSLTGPFVEIGTVFQHRPAITTLVNIWAVIATSLLLLGCFRAVKAPRFRRAGLNVLATLALLLVWPFTEAGRFLIPVVPCLLVVAVEALAFLAASRNRKPPRVLAAILMLAAAVPYSTYSLATNRAKAQRDTHADFDAACGWIDRQASNDGPVLTQHPAELYWQTGRQALGPAESPAFIARDIKHFGAAYLLIDQDRYANAPANPLSRYVRQSSAHVRKAWSREHATSSTRIYEILNAPAPRTGAPHNPHIGEN